MSGREGDGPTRPLGDAAPATATAGTGAAPAAACPRCAAPTAPGDRFCEACGADLRIPTGTVDGSAGGPTSSAAPCPHCGERAGPGDGFCPSCGLRRPDADHVEAALEGAAAISDRGHVRRRNEDAVALGRDPVDEGPAAAVVCDGVSSVPGSERAARAAADAALEHLLREGSRGDAAGRPGATVRLDEGSGLVPASDGERRTRAAVAAAAAAAADVVPAGTRNAPSCTLVCGLVDPATGVVTVGWVGDSRAYWLTDGTLEPSRPLTRDHVAATAPPGTVDPAVVAARPDAITRWLGADGQPEPDVGTFAPSGPGVLLLCSDGLWKYLPDAADLAALALPALRDAGPPAAAAALVEAALAAGGEDNVTVAVIPVPLTRRSSP